MLKWSIGGACAVLMFLIPLGAAATEQDHIYMGLFVLGSLPEDRNANLLGTQVPSTQFSSAVGAGLKVGVFPDVTRRILGVEFEYYGHGGHVTLPSVGSPAVQGKSNLAVLNSMASVIVRYPEYAIQPYIGAGIGLSQGILTNMDIPGRADRGIEFASAFAYQVVAGAHYTLTARTFAFAEYKYFGADYHWKGLALDFRTNYMLAGVGLRF